MFALDPLLSVQYLTTAVRPQGHLATEAATLKANKAKVEEWLQGALQVAGIEPLSEEDMGSRRGIETWAGVTRAFLQSQTKDASRMMARLSTLAAKGAGKIDAQCTMHLGLFGDPQQQEVATHSPASSSSIPSSST